MSAPAGAGPSLPSPPHSRRRHPGFAVILAVAVGGMVGSVLHGVSRTVFTELFGSTFLGLLFGGSGVGTVVTNPVTSTVVLLTVNLIGSFLLGVITGVSSRRGWPDWLTAGLGMGVLGAYTTLSGVVLVWTQLGPAAGFFGPVGVLVLLVVAIVVLAVQALLGALAGLAGLKAGGWRS